MPYENICNVLILYIFTTYSFFFFTSSMVFILCSSSLILSSTFPKISDSSEEFFTSVAIASYFCFCQHFHAAHISSFIVYFFFFLHICLLPFEHVYGSSFSMLCLAYLPLNLLQFLLTCWSLVQNKCNCFFVYLLILWVKIALLNIVTSKKDTPISVCFCFSFLSGFCSLNVLLLYTIFMPSLNLGYQVFFDVFSDSVPFPGHKQLYTDFQYIVVFFFFLDCLRL